MSIPEHFIGARTNTGICFMFERERKLGCMIAYSKISGIMWHFVDGSDRARECSGAKEVQEIGMSCMLW